MWASRPMKDVHGAEVWEYIRRLEAQNGEMKAHMGMMSEELKAVKRQINIQDVAKTSKQRKLNSEHRLVNSDKGLRVLDEEVRKEQEKKAKKNAAAEAKKLDDGKRLVARVNCDPNQPFEGSLKSQKQNGLLDIAYYGIGLKDMDKCVMADIQDTLSTTPTSITASMSLQCIHPYSTHLIAVVLSRCLLFQHPLHLNNLLILHDSHSETSHILSLQILHYPIHCLIFLHIFLHYHIHIHSLI